MEPLYTPPRDGLTYAEAQKLVEFEIGGKIYRVGIDETLSVVPKNDFEAKNENVSINILQFFKKILLLNKKNGQCENIPVLVAGCRLRCQA